MRATLFYAVFYYFTFVKANNIVRQVPVPVVDNFRNNVSAKIGNYPYPTNPMNDRAHGYLLQGKAQTAVSNYGNYIDIEINPNGVWGEYAYLYEVTFLAGIPGQSYSSNYSWNLRETTVDGDGFPIYSIWESNNAYDSWYADGDTNFVGILFDADEDYGRWEPDSVSRKLSADLITDAYQWTMDDENSKLILSTFGETNPNRSSARIGLIYPWALRPKLKSREDQFDFYDYGKDQEEWTQDDHYFYYGANTAESWFTRYNPSYNTDWHATTMSRVNTHGTEVTSGDIFSDTYVTDAADTYPLLAHSDYSATWPVRFNPALGQDEHFWPGWWSEDYNIYLPGCDNSRKDPDCWEEVPG